MADVTLYLVRHAPVLDQQGRIYGDDVEVDLTSTQKRLKELADILPPPSGTTSWLCSGSPRTKETALAVLAHYAPHNAPPEPPYKISVSPAFREQDFGDLIGQKHEDIVDHLQFINGNIYCPAPPRGESLADFIARVGQGIKDLHRIAQERCLSHVVIFTHGGTIRAARTYIQNAAPESITDRNTPPLYFFKHLFKR